MKKLNVAWPIEPQSNIGIASIQCAAHRVTQVGVHRAHTSCEMLPFVGPSDAAPLTLDQTNALNPFPAN